MAKVVPGRSVLALIVLFSAWVVIGLTGGAWSPWLALLAPASFMMGWSGGPRAGILTGTGLSVLLLTIVGYQGSHLSPLMLQNDLITFGLVGLAVPLGLARWARPANPNKKLVEQVRWQQSRERITQAVLSAEDTRRALEHAARGMEEIVTSDALAILLKNGRQLQVAHWNGPAADLPGSGEARLPQETLQAMCEGKSIIWEEAAGGNGLFQFQSGALIPLISPRGFVGAVYLGWRERNRLDGQANKRLIELAKQVARPLELIEEAQRKSFRDAQTGLYNVRMLAARLNEETAFAQRQGLPLGFLMFQLESCSAEKGRMKVIEDSVLEAAAYQLRKQCRASDLPVLYSETEFAILCPGLSQDDTMNVSARFQRAMQQAACGAGEQSIAVHSGWACYSEAISHPGMLIEEARREMKGAVLVS